MYTSHVHADPGWPGRTVRLGMLHEVKLPYGGSEQSQARECLRQGHASFQGKTAQLEAALGNWVYEVDRPEERDWSDSTAGKAFVLHTANLDNP